jgi:hypothetical protein
MSEARLDRFSERFAGVLFQRFPDWRQFEKVTPIEGQALGYLVVQVPASPFAMLERGLGIYTYDEEVTVALDHGHSHFNWPLAPEEAGNAWSDPLVFIEDILEERVGVVSWWKDDKWQGSSTFLKGENPGWERHDPSNRIRLRSWQGTLNADMSR